MSPVQADMANRLLAYMAPSDFAALETHLDPVAFPKGFQVTAPHQPVTRCYFPDTGIASIVAHSPEGQRAEVGLLGRDGLTPTSILLDADTVPQQIVFQVEGHGHVISCEALVDAIEHSTSLHKLLLRFVQTLSTQTAYTAMSNAIHHVEERLARWILMCDDRSDDGTIALTHEYIAIMLAVRRPSVTTALHVLEGNRLIYSDRGIVTVRDRLALETFAQDAYGVPEQEYARLIGPMRTRGPLNR